MLCSSTISAKETAPFSKPSIRFACCCSPAGFVQAAAWRGAVRLFSALHVVLICLSLHVVSTKKIAQTQIMTERAEIIDHVLKCPSRVRSASRHPRGKRSIVIDRGYSDRNNRCRKSGHLFRPEETVARSYNGLIALVPQLQPVAGNTSIKHVSNAMLRLSISPPLFGQERSLHIRRRNLHPETFKKRESCREIPYGLLSALSKQASRA